METLPGNRSRPSRSFLPQEMRAIFRNAWLYVGHESQLRNSGDFFTTRLGTDRIILARHSDRKIYAFSGSGRGPKA
jgi:phenylpropionate dioxygenase-like ring-hydroxylating dioxygenase large terminal subunit